MLSSRIFKLFHNVARNFSTHEALAKCRPPHVPVMSKEVLAYLEPSPNKIFLDMTFGAGGHTRQILDSDESVQIYTVDRDPVAFQYANTLQKEYPGRVLPLLGRFSEVPQLLYANNIKQNSFDGVLFDFGCSSMQFDEADRGFSVSKNGPLDMRMDRGRNLDQVTAADVVAQADEADLVKIFRIYGEEKCAKKIARAIVEARQCLHQIKTTKQLADLVASCMSEPYRLDKLQRRSHVATKIFQALRIFVNNELNEINYGMVVAHRFLKISGRLVTISFHSLEDTIVKRHINGNVTDGVANAMPLKYTSYEFIHDQAMVENLLDSYWKQLHKHVIVPQPEEIAANARSRSAKFRAAIKIK